ncbi:hypothetical protein JVX91_27930 [Pseudomonas sp. PDNC002]|uniref:hypothetical protein n=1 Tax=Pseudomonas sp. PDNC002 TaxID=2811422 RepID=UPI001963AF5F|nr:hypothetical protein [Pseudomonas sp. PDNC002]QRY79348.1 hypothetical protein JVX91_27930 [Pseudomonas sp. PDNC002]
MKKHRETAPDTPPPASSEVKPTLPGGEYGSRAERYSFHDRDKKQPTLPPSVSPEEPPAKTPPEPPKE